MGNNASSLGSEKVPAAGAAGGGQGAATPLDAKIKDKLVESGDYVLVKSKPRKLAAPA